MNEEALILAYNQAKATGYNGTQEQFQSLLTENDSALDLAYNQAKSTGFTGEVDAFGDLLGLKKKGSNSTSSDEDSPSISDRVSGYADNIVRERQERKTLEAQEGAQKFMNDTGFDVTPFVQNFYNPSKYVNDSFMGQVSQDEAVALEELNNQKTKEVILPRMAGDVGGFIRPKYTVDATKGIRAEGTKKIKSESKSKVQEHRIENMRNEILNSLPDEVKNNAQKMSELSDYLYLNFGINADLDGDGRYNDMASNIGPDSPFFFSKGAVSMAQTLGSGVSSAVNTALDITIDPALYYASTAAGMLVGAPRAFGEVYRATTEPMKESLRSLEVQVPDGMVGSIEKGNAWATANAFTNGLGASIPSVALAMAGPVGVATLGVGSGTSAYMEAKEDDAFENDWQRLGWGVVNGVSDLAFARVGNWTAAKIAAQAAAKKGGEEIAKGITKDYMKGAAFRYGVSMPVGALEEGSVAGVQILSKSYLTGEEIPDNWGQQMTDAAIMGAVIEPMFSSKALANINKVDPDLIENMKVENPSQVAYAAANSPADAGVAESKSKNTIQALVDQLEITTDEGQAARIKKQLNSLESEERKRAKAKTAFYNMMMMRFPADFEELRFLDLQIAKAGISYKELSTDDARKNYKEAIQDLVKNRLEIENKYKNENLSLSSSEQRGYNEVRVASKLRQMSAEINQIESSIQMEVQAEGTDLYDPQVIEQMKQKKAELSNNLARALASVNAINSAIDNLENADGTEFVDEYSPEYVESLESDLAEAVGMDFNEITRGQIQGQLSERESDSWMDTAIKESKNSQLNEESLKEVFSSDNFAMLTGENPNNTVVSETDNANENKLVRKYLNQKGLKFHEIKGRYDGKGENSFLVEGMTKEQAAEFAREFKQESVAHKDGLVLKDGSINLFEGEATFDQGMTDFFSAIKDAQGNTVKFSFMPGDSFLDAQGNSITEAEYNEKIKQEETSFEDLVQEAKTYSETKKPKEKLEEGVSSVAISKDGRSNLRAGTAGLKAGEVKSINNLIKLFTSVYGNDVKVFVYENKASATALGEGDTWGGLFNPNDNSIHINPAQIRENAKIEKDIGIKRIKTIAETMVEEVGHAVVEPAFLKLTEAEQLSIINEIKNISKNDKDLLQRLSAKEAVYSNSPELSPSDVRGELYMEFLSALAGGEGVNLGLADKARVIINKIIMKAFGAVGKQFTIKDPSQVIKIASALSNARQNGQVFKTAESAKKDQSRSKLISPAAIPQGKDGKVKIFFDRDLFRNGKSIGNYEDYRVFADKWHFVNWWKKATDMGSKSKFFGFRTEDGTTIDVDKIKNWGGKKSSKGISELSVVSDRFNDRINEAAKKGSIPRVVADKMLRKFGYIKMKAAFIKESESSYESLLKTAKLFEQKSIEAIKSISTRDGKPFSYSGDEAANKASQALKAELISDKEYGTSWLDYADHLNEFYYGMNTSHPKFVRLGYGTFFRDYYLEGKDPRDMSEIEIAKLGSEFISKTYSKAYNTEEKRLRVFGEDPVKFFENHNNAASLFIEELNKSVDSIESPQEQLIAYNFIVGLTSAQNPAQKNINVSELIFSQSAEYRSRGGDKYIDPTIIEDLSSGNVYLGENSRSGLPLSGVHPNHLKNTAKNLEVLNRLASENQREDGSVDFQAVLDGLSEYTSKEARNPNARAEGDSERVYKAQQIFGVKLGAFMLNLNGNEDVVTVDSHVGNVVQGGLGFYVSPEVRVERHIEELAEALNVKYSPGREKEILKALKDRTTELKGLINSGGKDYIPELKKLERICNKATIRAEQVPGIINKRHRTIQRVVISVAEKLGVTPAQAGQLMFADDQIMTGGFDMTKTNKYSTFAGATMKNRYKQTPPWKRSQHDSRRIEMLIESANSIELILDQAKDEREINIISNMAIESQAQEMKASSQLKMPFDPVMQAENSPLYRNRSSEEALKMKNDITISNESVMNALNTDATSRRIMSKESVIQPNQKVGVRLNLNVAKNTGVPVQTMHDKTATGEALKYAGVVTVKNAELYVNQDARRKIFTFQENKFPMASVNGGFVSDEISEANFNGVKAFFNPFKHNVFVDAEGRPIKSAEEATVVGNTVYLRGDIEYYDFKDPILKEGRKETEEQRAKRTKVGPKYDKALSRFEAYSKRVLGIEYNNREELIEAYNNMPVTSQVALDDSETAARAEQAQMRASANLFIRRTAGRMANKYGEIRADIMSNPENYFSKQSIQKSKDNLESMSDYDLMDIMTDDALGRLQNRNDDMSVLATSELIKRAVGRGDMGSVTSLISEAAKIGTTAGRLLRHFRELKQASPEGIYSIVAKAIEERGNKMSKDQDKKLRDISGELFRLQAEHEDLVKRAIRGEDVEVELKKKTEEVKAVERALDTFSNSMIEKGWGSIGKMLIQGNLLTSMSQITNIGANMINAIGKVGVDIIALPTEKLVNMFGFESSERKYSLNAYMYGMKRFGDGFVEAIDEIRTGQTDDVTEWRVNRGFAPFRSFMAAIGKGDLPITQEGNSIPVSQRLKLFTQGTLGIPAEVMFRFLSLGDTPFRRMVEGIELYQAGSAQGLEGEALKQFVKHPTKSDRMKAEEEGRKLTFQEPTVASRAAEDLVQLLEKVSGGLFDWIPGVDGRAASSFLIRSTVPYVRTPANILYDTLTFVTPYVAIPRMMNDLSKGDSRGASQNFAKLMVGSMVGQTTAMLIKEGLISGALDWEDDEEKNIAYDQFPPSSINVSGLNRLLKGEDTSHRPDDYFIGYNKLGVGGAIMGAIIKGVDPQEIKNRDYSGSGFVTHTVGDAFGVGAFSSIAHMMDQSFLQGVNGLVNVVASSDADDFQRNFERWFGTAFQAVSATALPNQLSAMYRADREYLPDLRLTKDMSTSDRILKRMEYTIRDRTFNLDGVPIRVDWKGNKIKQAPRGTNSYRYQLLDITKARQGEADAVSNEIYRLYESTEDLPKVVGTPSFAKKRSYNVPNIKKKHLSRIRRAGVQYDWMNDEEFMSDKVFLNTEQLNRMMAVAGKQRYSDVEFLMNTPKYKSMSDEERIEAINKVNEDYSSGIQIDGRGFKNHSVELFKVMQEIYDGRKEEN